MLIVELLGLLSGMLPSISSPEEGWCKTALVSRIPLKPVTLCRCDCEHRCAAALLDLQSHGCKHPVLVASVYLTEWEG